MQQKYAPPALSGTTFEDLLATFQPHLPTFKASPPNPRQSFRWRSDVVIRPGLGVFRRNRYTADWAVTKEASDERLSIILPIAGILYPLWSLLPKFYRWQMERRIYRVYGELRLIERSLHRTTNPAERAQMLARFQELERHVLELKIPTSFSEMSFNLKMHIRALGESVRKGA